MQTFTNIVVLGLYVVFASAKQAWPSHFVAWVWVLYVVYWYMDHYFDGVQYTALSIARIYMLQRFGTQYDDAITLKIKMALIPRSTVLLFPCCIIAGVASFTCLLLFQGWATALIAHCAVRIFGWCIPINYQRRLKGINAHVQRQLVTGEPFFGLHSITNQALRERRDLGEWWSELFVDATIREQGEQYSPQNE